MINVEQLMIDREMAFDKAFRTACIKASNTLEPIYIPALPTAYLMRELHHITNPVISILGDGPHASRIQSVAPGAGIFIDHRIPCYEIGCSCVICDIGFDTNTTVASVPLTIWGHGTENKMQAAVDIGSVQFGSPDKRSTYQGGPEHSYPDAWIELSGVIGATIYDCNFAGQRRGTADIEDSYFPVAPIHISADAGIVAELDGTSHPARSMKLLIEDCNFAPGCRHPILVEKNAWVEGLTIANNRMVDCWTGIVFHADPNNAGTGTALDIRDNNINFRRSALDIRGGVIDVRGNYFLPHARGVFAGSAHVRLDNVTLSHIRNNNFGISVPDNHPYYGVYVGSGCNRITVGPNNFQLVDAKIFAETGATNIHYVAEEWEK